MHGVERGFRPQAFELGLPEIASRIQDARLLESVLGKGTSEKNPSLEGVADVDWNFEATRANQAK